MWTPYRPQPKLPVQAYQTYAAIRPTSTHTRRATCQEVECGAYAKGWTTTIDTSTELGRKQANYVRLKSGRKFTVSPVVGTDLVEFLFPPGQRCFADHRVNLDRPTIYLKRGGDWRAETFPAVRMRVEDWVDDFATHQDQLATRRVKG